MRSHKRVSLLVTVPGIVAWSVPLAAQEDDINLAVARGRAIEDRCRHGKCTQSRWRMDRDCRRRHARARFVAGRGAGRVPRSSRGQPPSRGRRSRVSGLVFGSVAIDGRKVRITEEARIDSTSPFGRVRLPTSLLSQR